MGFNLGHLIEYWTGLIRLFVYLFEFNFINWARPKLAYYNIHCIDWLKNAMCLMDINGFSSFV